MRSGVALSLPLSYTHDSYTHAPMFTQVLRCRAAWPRTVRTLKRFVDLHASLGCDHQGQGREERAQYTGQMEWECKLQVAITHGEGQCRALLSILSGQCQITVTFIWWLRMTDNLTLRKKERSSDNQDKRFSNLLKGKRWVINECIVDWAAQRKWSNGNLIKLDAQKEKSGNSWTLCYCEKIREAHPELTFWEETNRGKLSKTE